MTTSVMPASCQAHLTPDERRQVGLAALTAAVVALATGLVNWGLEEAKSFVTERRRRGLGEVSGSSRAGYGQDHGTTRTDGAVGPCARTQ
jgi:hypothetical protein